MSTPVDKLSQHVTYLPGERVVASMWGYEQGELDRRKKLERLLVVVGVGFFLSLNLVAIASIAAAAALSAVALIGYAALVLWYGVATSRDNPRRPHEAGIVITDQRLHALEDPGRLA